MQAHKSAWDVMLDCLMLALSMVKRACVQAPAPRALLPASRLANESRRITMRDVEAAMQREPNYCRSTLLYKLQLQVE